MARPVKVGAAVAGRSRRTLSACPNNGISELHNNVPEVEYVTTKTTMLGVLRIGARWTAMEIYSIRQQVMYGTDGQLLQMTGYAEPPDGG